MLTILMANFTVEENYTSKLEQTNAATWPMGIVAFLSASNIFLSFIASFGNILILIVLPKVTSLHPPTRLLFRCLAVTDLCVGLILHPFHAAFLMSYLIKMNMNTIHLIGNVNSALSVVLCGLSGYISTATSVDRLLALLLGLRYRHVVTLSRVRVFIAYSWIIAVLLGSIYFCSHRVVWKITFIFLILCLVTSIFSYMKIHLTLRQHQAQIQEQVHQGQSSGGGIPLDIARYKKTVSSILWVQLALIVCYVPFCIVLVLRINEEGYHMAWLATATLVYLNSSLNPILYCWKIREVNQAVKDKVGKLCCSSS